MNQRLIVRALRNRPFAMLMLFIVVTSGFMLYRNSDVFVWNDTPGLISFNRPGAKTWPRAAKLLVALREEWAGDPIRNAKVRLHAAFTNTGDGYRPLDQVFSGLSRDISQITGPTIWQLLIAGSACGAFAVCLFLVARRFAKHDATALLAVVLMLGAPPLVSASWLVIAGLQVLVPLLICLALLLYWQIVESPRRRRFNVCALAAVLFFGPWCREFCGISCLLIAFLELQRTWGRTWRPTPLLAMAGIFFLHAVFPTAIVKLLFLPELPLLPVSRLGRLGSSLQSQGMHWWMAWQFLPLVPPLLMLLAICNGLRRAGRELVFERPRCWSDWKAHGWRYCTTGVVPWLWLAVVLTLCFCRLDSSQQSIFATAPTPVVSAPYVLGFALCLYVAIVGLQVDMFLVVWFLLAFVPLMRVVVEIVHFIYPLVPASIILACTVESLWQWAAAQRGWLRGVRYALTLAIGVIVIDQALVWYGTYRVMHGEAAAIRAVAAELRQRIPQGSLVIGNVVHATEIQWAANNHYHDLCSVPWGHGRPGDVVDEESKLDQLLAESQSQNKVYFLDCDFDYLPWKIVHRHKFVHQLEVEKQALGKLHVYSARYPFVDPLRHLVGRPNVPYLGPPDLENDFYRGHAIDGSWFTDEVYAEYHLYEVTGTRVVDPTPTLALADVHGFNIIACDHKFFGLPLSGGAFDLKKARNHQYAVCLEGASVEEVKRLIEAAPDISASPAVDDSAPRLACPNVRGCNIIACGGKFFGLPFSAGAFDLQKARDHQYAVCFEGTSVEEVKRLIEAAPEIGARPAADDSTPRLARPNVHGCNIIACDGTFFGLPFSAGAFDLKKARNHQYAVCFEGTSVEQVKRLIEASLAPAVSRKSNGAPAAK
ncbi:MAG TPA: hypothetical protein VHV55_00945 [Pirellulales bacterium]|jgi:hypothetical protein|nr:hypothetical protein [Pirellulales bacterium]